MLTKLELELILLCIADRREKCREFAELYANSKNYTVPPQLETEKKNLTTLHRTIVNLLDETEKLKFEYHESPAGDFIKIIEE